MSNEQKGNVDTKGVLIIVTLLSIIFSVIPSLVFWFLQGKNLEQNHKAYITNLLNFQITMFVVGLVCGVVFAPLVGLISLINLILLIVGAVKVNNNEQYKFPLTIDLIK